jgi:ketosteroid isomerase-like protein
MNRNAETRARIEDHWAASERGDTRAEHEIYAADAVLDYPQSGERFRGRAKIQAQRGGHPADRHFAVRRISGRGNLWRQTVTPRRGTALRGFCGQRLRSAG